VDADRLFLSTLTDLENRVHPAPNEYAVLGIAAVVRKLLLDELPLVDEVNRRRGLKINFRINHERPVWEALGSPRPEFWSLQDGLDPEASRRANPEEVSRKDFLATRVMLVRDREITVKDILSHTANVAGAVHRGNPRDVSQETLQYLEGQISVGGYPADVRSLQAIGRVVLRALQPLRDKVEADLAD
jgi:hypothetical protein